MSIIRPNILFSHPGAVLLALVLVALTAPALMLSHAAGGVTTSLPCAEINNNGCTELSATPPQDTQAVPPNIVLMLDDSGSMAWDVMPDWGSLPYNNATAARDPLNNGLYFNSETTYVPPPKADSTAAAPDLYPDSPGITSAYDDGFATPVITKNVMTYAATAVVDAGHQFAYYTSVPTTISNGTPYQPVEGCPGGYKMSGGTCVVNNPNPPTATATPQCPAGWVYVGATKMCTKGEYQQPPASAKCPSGYTPTGSVPVGTVCTGPTPPPTKEPILTCPSGGSVQGNPPMCVFANKNIDVFTFVPVNAPGTSTPRSGPTASPTSYFVAAGVGDNDCSNLSNATQQSHCVDASDTTGVFPDGTVYNPSPGGVSIGQNIANWFSYYRTRILMTKSGLMTAFVDVNPQYRFGFGSIDANGASAIPNSAAAPSYPFNNYFSSLFGQGGSTTNQLAVVQPFGDGSAGTQKALFWNWIVTESPQNSGYTGAPQTPLRLSLNAVGQYYQTAQPWTTMSSDPGYTAGSTTQFACRASYAILATDGFWNGADPATPAALLGAAGTNGPVNTVPSGDTTTQYLAVPPFSGPGGTAVGVDASGNPTTTQVPSLADVATYYWETDLQPGMPNEVATSTSDPAAWQHMTTYTIGLGFTPVGLSGTFTHPANPVQDIESWANGGAAIPGFAWPTPSANSLYNIADLAHAAINGHGEFFNVTSPDDLANALKKAFTDIAARTDTSPSAAANASVLSLGALSFSTSYETQSWSGGLKAVALNADGTPGTTEWDAGANLNADFHSATTYSKRNVYTDAYDPTKSTPFSAFQFTTTNVASLDSTESAELGGNPNCAAGGDTLCARINFLLGDPTNEGTGNLYRARPDGILGAIIHSQPVYVAAATGNYSNDWPVGSPEAATGAQQYDTFVTQASTRAGTVYVGANDGMLHAFDAPVPTNCVYSGTPPTPTCNYNPDGTAGNERWAFIPRAVYANLGNLTAQDFQFLPTVDATPVTRDVFFASDQKWHTILAGGVGLGGRGMYALDITDPTSFSKSDVLWEFDSDSSVAGCTSIVGSAVSGSCSASDLGYTISQPNIGRINYDNKWVVLVPNGYFPDCTTPDIPTATVADCQAIAKQAPGWSAGAPYSALFVLDAETGSVIAELKTPAISGVTSFGLATPVMGDYLGNQIDAVAFAGDVEGNLWRFDLSGATPSSWTVTLVYQAPVQGAQPITTMPRLFPDPTTNRFMVVFGTGKFLGIGDNSDATVQAIYGVRDVLGTTWTQSDLTQQYLHEETPMSGPYADISLRCVTGSASDASCTSSTTPINNVPASSGGWFINLQTTTSGGIVNDAGERVVATPAAIFSSNTVVVETLITGAQNTDACDPSTQGSILDLNVLSGGAAGISSLGGGSGGALIAGARITNALTSGSLPIVSAMGGGKGYTPGTCLLGDPACTPVSHDQPMWRRRSWQEINQNQ